MFGVFHINDLYSPLLKIAASIEAGRMFLPESAPWLNDFVDELADFLTGTRDELRRFADAGAELSPT